MNKQQKGGVRIKDNYNIQTAFSYFNANSQKELISTGSKTCYVYLLTLNDGVETPYESMRSDAFFSDDENLKQIKKIIVKVSIINDDASEEEFTWRGDERRHDYLSAQEFSTEVINQVDVFSETLGELEPCCPSIVFTEICPIEVLEAFQEMQDIQFAEDSRIALLAMELADGYVSLWSVRNNSDYRKLAIYELCRLASFGFLHADPHMLNIFINPNYDYIDDFTGRALLIDFGNMTRVHPDDIFNSHEAITALLNDDTWGPGHNRGWQSYAWLLEYENEGVNEITREINDSRIDKIQALYGRTGRTAEQVQEFIENSRYVGPNNIGGGKKKPKTTRKYKKRGGRSEALTTRNSKNITITKRSKHAKPSKFEDSKFKELVNYIKQERMHGEIIKKHAKRFRKNYVSLSKPVLAPNASTIYKKEKNSLSL